jgi:small subunit ribosomal protein MRP21
MNKGSSADDILAAFNAHYSPLSPYSSARNTSGSSAEKFEVADLMKDISNEMSAPPPPRTPLRLTPTTGRTMHVTQMNDLARSFQLLEASCRRNKIKQTFNYQRFHERPGLKRKRLKSERWRRRFMLGFKAAVNRVKQMKKQGW